MEQTMIETLSRAQLAELVREYMLAAHLNNRSAYAALQIKHGREVYKPVAIDNWMASSPIYSQRMQTAMRLKGESDVETIFKGMQLEVGLSHQYFDARFNLRDRDEGEFWLHSCGPLLEVEPMGDDAVRDMCHDIEDPTFDATAVATNPRARIRPYHRPPRISEEQVPHCHWRVYIDHGAEPLQEAEVTRRLRTTKLAQLSIDRPQPSEIGGLDYYDVPLFETLQLERFSQPALVVICKEIAVQIHLLNNSLQLAIADRFGEADAREISLAGMVGGCWSTSERLAHWLGYKEGGLDAIEQVISVHPAFMPREYFGLEAARVGTSLELRFNQAPAADETLTPGWYGLMAAGELDGLAALVQGVDSRAHVASNGENVLSITIDPAAAAAQEPLPVQIAKGSVVYQSKLENHIQLLEVS
jgi:hypothetical protein